MHFKTCALNQSTNQSLMSYYLVTAMVGATMGWFSRALLSSHVPNIVERMEARLLILLLGWYARWLRHGLYKQPHRIKKGILVPGDVELLQWTAVYHPGKGEQPVRGPAAEAEIAYLLNGLSIKDGYVCVDYRIAKDPTRFRVAFDSNTVYDSKENADCDWPFYDRGNSSHGDIDLNVRPSITRAIFTSDIAEHTFDVSRQFSSYDGPCNNLSGMTSVTLAELLRDCNNIAEKFRTNGTMQFNTIRGTLSIPIHTRVDDAHNRLCVIGGASAE